MLIGKIARSCVTTVEKDQENIVENDEETNNGECLCLKLFGIVDIDNNQNYKDELRDDEQGCED